MEVKLKEIAEIFSGVHISRYLDENSQDCKVIKNRFSHENILDYSHEHVSKDINMKYYSKKGDIIISLSQPNTVSLLHEDGFIIPMFFGIIRIKKGFYSSYVYHLLNSEMFHKKIYSFLEGGNLRVIKIEYLKNIKINIPNLEMQKKYGELLDKIDRKNELLEDKKRINVKLKEFFVQKK